MAPYYSEERVKVFKPTCYCRNHNSVQQREIGAGEPSRPEISLVSSVGSLLNLTATTGAQVTALFRLDWGGDSQKFDAS